MAKLPRGVSNNNPGNIDRSPANKWQGLARDQSSDPRFCVFTSPAYGIRAIARLLISYQDKYDLDTVRKIISRWAPPKENDTGEYVRVVAKSCGVHPDEYISTHQYKVLKPLVESIIRHENGKGPKGTLNSWYDDATINEALRLAGVKSEVTSAAVLGAPSMPVTKETVGATGTGALGIAQLADVAPDVMDALDTQGDNLTSGQIVRIALGVVTIAIAVFIAYSQVMKYRKGTL